MPNRACPSLSPLPLLVVGALLACNDTAYYTAPPEVEPSGPYYTVSGMVSDSLTGQGVAGARVYAGKRTTLTDANGIWYLEVPDGDVTVTSAPNYYDAGRETIVVHGPVMLNLQLRRRAPIILNCYREGTEVRALLIDLQGRKSVERWTQSKATILAPSGNLTIGAANWRYLVPPDYIHWPIGMPIPDDATGIKWDIYDNEGYRYTGSCELGPVSG